MHHRRGQMSRGVLLVSIGPPPQLEVIALLARIVVVFISVVEYRASTTAVGDAMHVPCIQYRFGPLPMSSWVVRYLCIQ